MTVKDAKRKLNYITVYFFFKKKVHANSKQSYVFCCNGEVKCKIAHGFSLILFTKKHIQRKQDIQNKHPFLAVIKFYSYCQNRKT